MKKSVNMMEIEKEARSWAETFMEKWWNKRSIMVTVQDDNLEVRLKWANGIAENGTFPVFCRMICCSIDIRFLLNIPRKHRYYVMRRMLQDKFSQHLGHFIIA